MGSRRLALDQPTTEPRQPTLLLEASNGGPLGRAGPLKITQTSLKDFAPVLIKAVLSTEDRRFYAHPGVDFRASCGRHMPTGSLVKSSKAAARLLSSWLNSNI